MSSELTNTQIRQIELQKKMDQYLQEYPHSIIINDFTILPIWIEESFIDLGDVDIQNSPELFEAQNEIIIPAMPKF